MSISNNSNPRISPPVRVLLIATAVGMLLTGALLAFLADIRDSRPKETTVANGTPRSPTVTPTVVVFQGTPSIQNEKVKHRKETRTAKASVVQPTEVQLSPPQTPIVPSGMYTSFTDPRLYVSFEYPDNWYVVPSDALRDYIVLQNIDPSKIGMTKGIVASSPNQFNSEIEPLFDALEAYASFEEWVETVARRIPAGIPISRTNLENVDGHRAIEILYNDPAGTGYEVGEIFIEKNKSVYHIRVIPGDTKYTEILAHVLHTMRFD